jgi:hypothetical protein
VNQGVPVSQSLVVQNMASLQNPLPIRPMMESSNIPVQSGVNHNQSVQASNPQDIQNQGRIVI